MLSRINDTNKVTFKDFRLFDYVNAHYVPLHASYRFLGILSQWKFDHLGIYIRDLIISCWMGNGPLCNLRFPQLANALLMYLAENSSLLFDYVFLWFFTPYNTFHKRSCIKTLKIRVLCLKKTQNLAFTISKESQVHSWHGKWLV